MMKNKIEILIRELQRGEESGFANYSLQELLQELDETSIKLEDSDLINDCSKIIVLLDEV